MRLYDSLAQEKREFSPRDGDHVTMYFCGPTVYNYIHLGNARPFVTSLVAKRYFESRGWRVTLVENITDIDDRIIQRGTNEERPWNEVAEQFASAYIEDTDRLGLGRPDVEPRATEHIPEIIDLIGRLVERDHAYVSGGDVYFDVSSFAEYGRLSKQNTDEMLHGVRIAPGEEKQSPLDFAVWKGAKPGEPAWDSPWGPGRPGWHIECSAMSLKYLQPGFDIHGGGRDLIFPHHENELAQAEGALGTSFVRFWAHNGMLNTQTEKMSKSVGNIFLLREALKEYAPETLIMYFVSSHYRSPMEFSRELLEEARQQVERLRNLFRSLEDYAAGAGATGNGDKPSGEMVLLEKIESHQKAFNEAMDDDLNTAAALGEVFALAREVNTALHAQGALSAPAVDAVRGRVLHKLHVLGLDAVARTQAEVPAEVVELAEQRRERRKARDFAAADRLRDEIREKGYEVRDVGDGFKLIPLQ
jgi:cysteinyl-tRNA synthetase